MKAVGFAHATWHQYKPYLLAWIWVVLGACLVPTLFFNQGPAPFKAVMVSQAVAVTGLGFVLNPGWQSRPCRLSVPAWSFFLALAAGLVTAANEYKMGLHMGLSVKTAFAVFTLSFFMHGLTRAVMTLFTDNRHIPWTILCFILLLTTLPLWIAPWAEAIAAPPKLDMLLWSSPLSYLSGMLDYDYLRNQWFYQHTPYGMLRYEYPDKILSSVGLIGVSLLLLGIKTSADLQNNPSETL